MPFGPKKTVADVWPLRSKRILVIVDPKMVLSAAPAGATNDSFNSASCPPTSVSTIRALTSKGAKVIVMSSNGDGAGIPLNLPHANREIMVTAFQQEGGAGYTNFFSTLPGADKLNLLKSAGITVPSSVSASRFSGKTKFFAKLSVEEKVRVLEAHIAKNPVFFAKKTTKEVFETLKSELSNPVVFVEDPLGASGAVSGMSNGAVVVLENLRLYAAETSTRFDERNEFAHVLSSYGDVLVNDAFNISHKTLASTINLPRILRHCAAGHRVEKELAYFRKLVTHPARPLAVVIGGIRIAEKLNVLESLLVKVDKVLVAGQVAVPFLQSVGISVGQSAVAEEHVRKAADIMHRAARLNVRIVLPTDHVIAPSTLPVQGHTHATQSSAVPADQFIVDVGPNTLYTFVRELKTCRTVFWTGPFGVHGDAQSEGSVQFARAVAAQNLLSIVGGRNTCAAVREAGVAANITHLCSGGVACLEVLRGNPLPGIESISDSVPPLDSASAASASELLRRLPLFAGCTSHNLTALARKAVRRSHARGDCIIYGGDRHMSMWVVVSGSLVCFPPDAVQGSSQAARTVALGHAVGQYEFITQTVAPETVVARTDATVTYQITSAALWEVANENPDFCPQLILNLAEPLQLLGAREHAANRTQQAITARDLQVARMPLPDMRPPGWTVDAVVNGISATVASGVVGAIRGVPASSSLASALTDGIKEVFETTIYHGVIRATSNPVAAALAAGLAGVPARAAVLSGKLQATPAELGMAGAISCGHVASHSLFVAMRAQIEGSARATAAAPVGPLFAIAIAMVCRSIAAAASTGPSAGTAGALRRLLLAVVRAVVFLLAQTFTLRLCTRRI